MVPWNGNFIPIPLIYQLFTFIGTHCCLYIIVLRITSKFTFGLGSNRPFAAMHPADIAAQGAVAERVIGPDSPAFIVPMPGAHAVTRVFDFTGIVDNAVM